MTQSSLFPEQKKRSKIEDPNFDITASHHGGNPESVQANKIISALKSEVRKTVYNFALKQGDYGITADEVAYHFECSHNHVAPRITELKALKLLFPSKITRRTRTGSPARVLLAMK